MKWNVKFVFVKIFGICVKPKCIYLLGMCLVVFRVHHVMLLYVSVVWKMATCDGGLWINDGEFVLLRMTKSNILFLHGRKIMILRSWLDLWLLYYGWQDTCYKLSAKASFTFLGASLFLFWEWTCALWTCNLCKITIVILILSKWMHVL